MVSETHPGRRGDASHVHGYLRASSGVLPGMGHGMRGFLVIRKLMLLPGSSTWKEGTRNRRNKVVSKHVKLFPCGSGGR